MAVNIISQCLRNSKGLRNLCLNLEKDRQRREEESRHQYVCDGFYLFWSSKNSAESCVTDDHTQIKSQIQLAMYHVQGSWFSMKKNRNCSFYSHFLTHLFLWGNEEKFISYLEFLERKIFLNIPKEAIRRLQWIQAILVCTCMTAEDFILKILLQVIILYIKQLMGLYSPRLN